MNLYFLQAERNPLSILTNPPNETVKPENVEALAEQPNTDPSSGPVASSCEDEDIEDTDKEYDGLFSFFHL